MHFINVKSLSKSLLLGINANHLCGFIFILLFLFNFSETSLANTPAQTWDKGSSEVKST